VLRERARELRQEVNPVEAVLWSQLRDRRFRGLKFRRQYVLGPFIADFYCAQHRLVVELDGATHEGPGGQGRDRERDAWMVGHGIRVVRLPAAIAALEAAIDSHQSLWNRCEK